MSQRPKALLAAWILAAAPALADSRIVVPEATREAGLVVKGETIRHTFLIRNEGTTDLHISEVRPSCGCTAAEFDRVVGPGKEGRVVLAVETRSFQGPISKSALVLSDDPVSPQTTLLIKADVKPFVDVLPGGYLRIQALAGEPVAAEVTLVSDEAGFAPGVPEVPQPWLKAEIRPLKENERLPGKGPKQFRLRVVAAAGAPEGLVGGSIKVPTGIGRQPSVEVPLSGFVRPSVATSVSKISFQNFVPEGEPVRRVLTLTNNDPKNESFKVVEASSSVAGIVVEVVPVDRQKTQVVLTIDPKIRKGPIEGTLVIKTTDRVRPEIRIPLTGTVLERAAENPPKR